MRLRRAAFERVKPVETAAEVQFQVEQSLVAGRRVPRQNPAVGAGADETAVARQAAVVARLLDQGGRLRPKVAFPPERIGEPAHAPAELPFQHRLGLEDFPPRLLVGCRAEVRVVDGVRADLVAHRGHLAHVVPGEVGHGRQAAVPGEGVPRADETRRHEERGGQAVFRQDAGGEQVVAVAVVEGDGDGARRHVPAGAGRVEHLGQRRDVEATAEPSAQGAETAGGDGQPVLGDLVGDAVEEEDDHEAAAGAPAQPLLHAGGARVQIGRGQRGLRQRFERTHGGSRRCGTAVPVRARSE